MIVKNAVGGILTLPELGVTLNPGETIDLSLVVSNASIMSSKELRRALEVKHLLTIDPHSSTVTTVENVFDRRPMLTSFSKQPSIRRAVLISNLVLEKETSFANFSLRSSVSKKALIERTRDTTLLKGVIRNEPNSILVKAAISKLNQLETSSSIHEGV